MGGKAKVYMGEGKRACLQERLILSPMPGLPTHTHEYINN